MDVVIGTLKHFFNNDDAVKTPRTNKSINTFLEKQLKNGLCSCFIEKLFKTKMKAGYVKNQLIHIVHASYSVVKKMSRLIPILFLV